jgi:hypothetical protein
MAAGRDLVPIGLEPLRKSDPPPAKAGRGV